EAARLRRRRLHRVQLRPPAGARARRRGRRARQAHLCRAPGEPPGPVRHGPRLAASRGDRGRRRGRRGDRRLRGGGQLRRRDARRPLDRRARRVRHDQRAGHLRPARGRPRARPASRADLHRRGLRLDRVGLLHRGLAAAALLAVLGDQDGRRPAGRLLSPHLRSRDGDLPRLEQLRAVPVPREADPADDPQRPARRPPPGLRGRHAGAQLDLRRGLRPRDRHRAGARRAGRPLQRRRAGRVRQHRGRPPHPRAHRCGRGPRRARRRSSRPRPALFAVVGAHPRTRLGAAGPLRRRHRPHGRLVSRQRVVVGAGPLRRLPRLLRAPVRPRAAL
ncbi:MAG: dTDP-glucose 4,6-dehydratase, partial [uncultured Solirubrobacteraceae bacterium]